MGPDSGCCFDQFKPGCLRQFKDPRQGKVQQFPGCQLNFVSSGLFMDGVGDSQQAILIIDMRIRLVAQIQGDPFDNAGQV